METFLNFILSMKNVLRWDVNSAKMDGSTRFCPIVNLLSQKCCLIGNIMWENDVQIKYYPSVNISVICFPNEIFDSVEMLPMWNTLKFVDKVWRCGNVAKVEILLNFMLMDEILSLWKCYQCGNISRLCFV